MISSGFKKLAVKYNMAATSGVAYGCIQGLATTFSEGNGFKRIDIATKFNDAAAQDQILSACNAANTERKYAVRNILLNQGNINIIFADTIGTLKKIEEFIQWFYPLLIQHGATPATVCPECGTPISGGSWYLINSIAYYMHDACAQKLTSQLAAEAQELKDPAEGSYVTGALGAIVGALLGSVVWALVLSANYIASIVGFVIGFLAEKGYNLCKGKQAKGKIVILVIAIILGVVVGTIAPDVVYLAQGIADGTYNCSYAEIPALLMSYLTGVPEYASSLVTNMLAGLLFAALGVYALLKKAGNQVSSAKIKKLS